MQQPCVSGRLQACQVEKQTQHKPAACLKDEVLAAQVLAGAFAWPLPPAQVAERRRPAPASTTTSDSASGNLTDSEGEEYHRPRKVRVLPSPAGPESVLARRTYTWRGIRCRRAEKQLRQLDALQQQQQQVAAADAAAVADAGASPAHSSGSAGAALSWDALPTPTSQQQGVTAASIAQQQGGGSGSSSKKEGDRDWAALTTWLRMNIHNARTTKKAVQFVGCRRNDEAGGGRWSFRLNPALTWADISPDTRHRLRHLPAEAAKAFAAKYPARPPGDWKLKSQKYKPPGSQQTHLVLLEDLVLSLHAVYLQHEGGSSNDGSGNIGGGRGAAAASGSSCAAAGAAELANQLASCGTSAAPPLLPLLSALQLPALPLQLLPPLPLPLPVLLPQLEDR